MLSMSITSTPAGTRVNIMPGGSWGQNAACSRSRSCSAVRTSASFASAWAWILFSASRRQSAKVGHFFPEDVGPGGGRVAPSSRV